MCFFQKISLVPKSDLFQIFCVCVCPPLHPPTQSVYPSTLPLVEVCGIV